MTTDTKWHTSSYSAPNNNCVELAHRVDGIAIRDTKDRDGGILRLDAVGFAAFLETIKRAVVAS